MIDPNTDKEAREKVTKKATDAKVKKELKECTFKPSINR